jgi:hypothetical protein
MPGHWTFLLLGLCGVLLYAVVMPSMMVSQIEVTNSHHKVVVTLTSGHGRLTGSKSQLHDSTKSHSRRELALKDPPQLPKKQPEQGLSWKKFWGTDLERGECSSFPYSAAEVQSSKGLQASLAVCHHLATSRCNARQAADPSKSGCGHSS